MSRAPNKDAYVYFYGQINQQSVAGLVSILTACTGELKGLKKPAEAVHLLFHSRGGLSADGIFLHNFLKAYPKDLIIYNGGVVESSAVTAFIGAKRRVACPNSTFMVHASAITIKEPVSMEVAKTNIAGMHLDEVRTEAILKTVINLPESEWAKRLTGEIWFTTERAMECGIIEAVAEFRVPTGAPFFSA